LLFVRNDTAVSPGNVVNIVGEFDGGGVCRITNQSNLIVVEPDRLLSGTSVVSSVRCMRRYQHFILHLLILKIFIIIIITNTGLVVSCCENARGHCTYMIFICILSVVHLHCIIYLYILLSAICSSFILETWPSIS